MDFSPAEIILPGGASGTVTELGSELYRDILLAQGLPLREVYLVFDSAKAVTIWEDVSVYASVSASFTRPEEKEGKLIVRTYALLPDNSRFPIEEAYNAALLDACRSGFLLEPESRQIVARAVPQPEAVFFLLPDQKHPCAALLLSADSEELGAALFSAEFYYRCFKTASDESSVTEKV